MAKNSKTLVPEAKEALNKFKMEAASEVGVNLNQGYNGDLTSRQAGSVGGQMVNNMNPVRTMRFERHNRISQGHKITVKYAFSLTV
ncbi:MAG: alpha/beta-type small acid-soluble spore protein [Clostridia bacterium]|nr:alpha/beta-type small acid-soluble spore protein [Clostridia bacterium]MBQ4575184.1 alpha/beta-type small acid-soluble spore protein [Clostridia bacterium]